MSYNKLFITITMLMLIFAACRKEWTATEEDMTNYGWTLFEQASLDLSSNTAEEDFDYVLKWFEDATKKDTSYQDGYNGMGWTYAKLSLFKIPDDDLNDLNNKSKKDTYYALFQRLITITLLWPPNPNEFDMVTFTFLARALFGI